MRAVTNAGPLIHLSWLDHLELLPALYDEVIAPEAVRDEVLHAKNDVPGAAALRAAFARGWPTVRRVSDVEAVAALQASLDPGEAEALVLMREVGADLVLLDERRARAYAVRQQLRKNGTLGILREARDLGLVPAVGPLLDTLRGRGFRISGALVAQIEREEGGGT